MLEMMRVLVVFAVLAVGRIAHAEMAIPFDLDRLSLEASEIVIADRVAGSKFEIVETWVGTLAPKTTIDVPHVSIPTVCCPDRKLTNKRVLLFLVNRAGTWRGARHPQLSAAEATPISVAWLDNDDLFALLGQSVDEQRTVQRLDTFANVRAVVADYRDARERVAASDARPIDKRLATLDPLVRHARRNIAAFAIAKLGAIGAPAVGRLDAILADPTLEPLHHAALRALAVAASTNAAKHLARVLAREVPFWKASAKRLRALTKQSKDGGWWNEISAPDVAGFRDRYGLAHEVLVVLGEVGGGSAQKSVRDFCKLWPTLPPIGFDTRVDARGSHKVASTQMREACTRALAR
jgi:hypothetical protein